MSDHSTDPGHKTTEQIEAEIAAERGRIAQTVEALQDRISPSDAFERALDAMSREGGAVMGAVSDVIRRNPVPAALIGVGAAWLLVNSARGDTDGYDRRRYYSALDYDDYDDDHDRRDFEEHRGIYQSQAGEPIGARRFAGPRYRGLDHDPVSEDGGESVTDRLRRNRDAALGKAGDAAGSARDAAAGAAEGARRRVSDAADAAGDAYRDAMGRARRHGAEAGRAARRGGYKAKNAVEENPMIAGALAFAAGAALGGSIPNTRAENALMGEQADQVRSLAARKAEEARDVAQRAGAEAVAEAKRVGAELVEQAVDAAPDPQSAADRGEEKAREAIDRIAGAAKAGAQSNPHPNGAHS